MDPAAPSKSPSQARSLILGGLLPVVLFTVVEETAGTLWGLIVGMGFGLGEILYEKYRHGKVAAMTWIGNGLILVLGGVALVFKEGIWFKLQPAIMEVAMAALLVGSVVVRRPFLTMMAEKQGALDRLPAPLRQSALEGFRGITLRLGVFLLAHAGLAAWAAFAWSTRAWALLKGVGFTVSLFLYVAVEAFVLRGRIQRSVKTPRETTAS